MSLLRLHTQFRFKCHHPFSVNSYSPTLSTQKLWRTNPYRRFCHSIRLANRSLCTTVKANSRLSYMMLPWNSWREVTFALQDTLKFKQATAWLSKWTELNSVWSRCVNYQTISKDASLNTWSKKACSWQELSVLARMADLCYLRENLRSSTGTLSWVAQQPYSNNLIVKIKNKVTWETKLSNLVPNLLSSKTTSLSVMLPTFRKRVASFKLATIAQLESALTS